MTAVPETQHSQDQPRGRSTREYWDIRHATSRPEASGTLAHSSAANEWFYRAKKNRIREILRWSHISLKGLRVLDAACGSGQFVDFFLREGAASVLGIDFSSVAICSCKKRFAAEPKCRFGSLDLGNKLPTDMVGSFDLVCCFDAIYLLPSIKHFHNGLRNLCNALKPGGHLLISDHYPLTSTKRHDDLVHHSHDVYTQIFEEGRLREIGIYLQTAVFLSPILPSRFQRSVEIYLPWSLYVLDRLLLCFNKPITPAAERYYYLIAQKDNYARRSV